MPLIAYKKLVQYGAMLRRLLILFLFAFLLFGCSMGNDDPPEVDATEVDTAVSANINTPPQPPPVSTDTPAPTDPPTPLPTLTPSPVPPDLSIITENVHIYPVPALYAGDQATFQILAHVPDNIKPEDVTVHILVDYQDIDEGTLSRTNLAGDAVGLFEWSWDTTDQFGEHLVHIILDRHDLLQAGDENRDNNQVAVTVTVYDPLQLAPNERNATWVTAETACCLVHVVSGTAAYRDLSDLLTEIETAVSQSVDALDVEIEEKLDIYLIDRVIGQGGYAGNDIVISYSDRQYASQGFYEVTAHEATHVLDRQFAPDRITFLAEGLAVWSSGGHYKPENINERAAALVTIGEYIPLATLIDNFYPVQHEIGYLEAAGFVNYLVQTYGWPTFRYFYADVKAEDSSPLSAVVDRKMQQYFGVTLAQAERDWLDLMTTQTVPDTAVIDLQTSIRYYNTMRRYQQLHDPTAYFLTAWLPYPKDLQEVGNPADLSRHPEDEINIILETMLISADKALRIGDYHRANVLLDSITRTLDNNGVFVDPIGINYQNVVRTTTREGYEVQQITLDGDRALVQATKPNSQTLTTLDFKLNGQDWVLLN